MDCPYRYIVDIDMIYNILSKIVHTGNVGASGSSPALSTPVRVHVVGIPPGIDRVSAVHVLRATFQSPLQLRGGALG